MCDVAWNLLRWHLSSSTKRRRLCHEPGRGDDSETGGPTVAPRGGSHVQQGVRTMQQGARVPVISSHGLCHAPLQEVAQNQAWVCFGIRPGRSTHGRRSWQPTPATYGRGTRTPDASTHLSRTSRCLLSYTLHNRKTAWQKRIGAIGYRPGWSTPGGPTETRSKNPTHDTPQGPRRFTVRFGWYSMLHTYTDLASLFVTCRCFSAQFFHCQKGEAETRL